MVLIQLYLLIFYVLIMYNSKILTSKYAFSRNAERIFDMVICDFLERFKNQGTNPNTDVSGNYMHQTKSSNDFESVDI